MTDAKVKMNPAYLKIEEEVLAALQTKSFTEIETDVKSYHSKSLDSMARMIVTLGYLSNMERWRQNPYYAKASFKVYLQSNYGMSFGYYCDEKAAISLYYSEAEQYGIDTIVKIKRICGLKKAPSVFEEIDKQQAQRKTPFDYEKVEKIIRSFVAPKKAKPEKQVEPDYRMIAQKLNDTKRDLEKELEEARGQIIRLKATVERLKTVNSDLSDEVNRLKRGSYPIFQGALPNIADSEHRPSA